MRLKYDGIFAQELKERGLHSVLSNCLVELALYVYEGLEIGLRKTAGRCEQNENRDKKPAHVCSLKS